MAELFQKAFDTSCQFMPLDLSQVTFKTTSMKTTSVDSKSIRAKINSMIDNEYYATLAMLKEQHEELPDQLSENGEHEMSSYFAHQIVHNKEATIGYLLELRESLKEAINNPHELKRTLRELKNEARQSSNELIFDMFSDVIEYIEEVDYSSIKEYTTCLSDDEKNILKAA